MLYTVVSETTPQTDRRKGYHMIYFIQSGNDGPIKIGVTNGDVEKRLRNLQLANPEPLRLLATMDGDSDTECELHKRFDLYRIRGEWFAPSAEVIGFINTLGPAKEMGAVWAKLDRIEDLHNEMWTDLNDILAETNERLGRIEDVFSDLATAVKIEMAPESLRGKAPPFEDAEMALALIEATNNHGRVRL